MDFEIDAAPDYVATEDADVAPATPAEDKAEAEGVVDEEALAEATGASEEPEAQPKAEPKAKAKETQAEVPDEAVEREKAKLDARRVAAENEALRRRVAELEAAPKPPPSKIAARIGELMSQGMSEQEAYNEVNKEFLARKLAPETAAERMAREAAEKQAEAERRLAAATEAEYAQAGNVVFQAVMQQLTEEKFPSLVALGAEEIAGLATQHVLAHHRQTGSLRGMDLGRLLQEEEARAAALLGRVAASPKAREKLGLPPLDTSASPPQKGTPSQTRQSTQEDAVTGGSRTTMVTARDAATRVSADMGEDEDYELGDYADLDAKLAKKYGL